MDRVAATASAAPFKTLRKAKNSSKEKLFRKFGQLPEHSTWGLARTTSDTIKVLNHMKKQTKRCEIAYLGTSASTRLVFQIAGVG